MAKCVRFCLDVPGRGLKEGDSSDENEDLRMRGASKLPDPYHIFGLSIPAYSHPRVQACMLGCVLFMTVGMYNVITFIGGAGQQTAWLSDIANIALYCVFTVFCLIAPACLNFFGIQWTLCFGGFGYAAYAASLWCYNHTQNYQFVIFGGCWCGLSAAFLWCAEGTAITAYASEEKKGLYFGVVIGAAIPVAQNWNAGTGNGSRVNDGTYMGMMILMLCGAFLGLALCPWWKIVREDGSRVILKQDQDKSFKEQLVTSARVLKKNWWIIFFCPMMWAVNFYVIYQNNDFNGIYFTVRGRALNTFLSGVVQLIAPWILRIFTDLLPLRRRQRAWWALVYVFVAFNALWLGGYWIMKRTRGDWDELERVDIYDKGYGIAAFVFIMYGYMDATYNCYCFWFIGALSNKTEELAVYSALYRLLNAACQIAAYGLDLDGYSKEFMFGSAWAFCAAGPIFVLPVLRFWLKDTNMEDGPSITHGVVVEQVSDEKLPTATSSEVLKDLA